MFVCISKTADFIKKNVLVLNDGQLCIDLLLGCYCRLQAPTQILFLIHLQLMEEFKSFIILCAAMANTAGIFFISNVELVMQKMICSVPATLGTEIQNRSCISNSASPGIMMLSFHWCHREILNLTILIIVLVVCSGVVMRCIDRELFLYLYI